MNILGTVVYDNSTPGTIDINESGAEGLLAFVLMRHFDNVNPVGLKVAPSVISCTYGLQSGTQIIRRTFESGNWVYVVEWWQFDKADVDNRVSDTVAPTYSGLPSRYAVGAFAIDTEASIVTVEIGASNISSAVDVGPVAGAANALLAAVAITDNSATKLDDGFTQKILNATIDAELAQLSTLSTVNTDSKTAQWTQTSADWIGSIIRIDTLLMIVSVDADDTILSEQQDVAIVTTGAGETQGTVSITSGSQTASCSIDSWSDTAIQIDVPDAISNDLLFGSASVRVTHDDASYDDHDITLDPKSGYAYVVAGTINDDAEQSVLAAEHWDSAPVTGDQVYYPVATDQADGSYPSTLTIADTGVVTIEDADPSKAQTFAVRIGDSSDDTWGTAKQFRVANGVLSSAGDAEVVAQAATQRVVKDVIVKVVY